MTEIRPRRFAIGALTLVLLLCAGCSEDAGSHGDAGTDDVASHGSHCGDGTCDADENSDNCSEDCGTCPTRCTGNGDIRFCDEDGNEKVLPCPDDLGSTCQEGDGTAQCSCGSVGETGACRPFDNYEVDAVACTDGTLSFFTCPDGTSCQEDGEGASCACDNAEDGVCPENGCPEDPDCRG